MAGLNLKSTPVASPRVQLHFKKAFEVLAEVQEQVQKMGVPPYPKPESQPPPLSEVDVGILTNRELETWMARYVAYAQYLGPKLAEAEAAYRIAGSNLKTLQAHLKVQLFKDKVAKAEILDRVRESPEYQEADIELLKLFAAKEVLNAYYKSYSKQAAALSRVVEIRKLEFEQELRHHNVSNHRGGVPGRLARGPRETPRGK